MKKNVFLSQMETESPLMTLIAGPIADNKLVEFDTHIGAAGFQPSSPYRE